MGIDPDLLKLFEDIEGDIANLQGAKPQGKGKKNQIVVPAGSGDVTINLGDLGKKHGMSRFKLLIYTIIAVLLGTLLIPVIGPRVAPMISSIRNVPAVVSVLGLPTGGGVCVDIVDSIAAGVDSKGGSWGTRTKSTMGRAVNGAQFWKDGHSGGVDILGKHMTPVLLPVPMVFWGEDGSPYTDENRYGAFRQFRWRSKDGKQDLIFYFGHLDIGSAPAFEKGREYPAETIVGKMTDGGPYASRWLYFHTHLQIEPAGKIDGAGDVDPEKWWKENCSQVAAVTGGSNMPITGRSTISAARIDEVLAFNASPMQGVGAKAVAEGAKRNINPAMMLVWFRDESTYGTVGVAVQTKSIGNIICTAGYSCVGRFRSHASWEDGMLDWYKLIDEEYVKARGLTGVHDILLVYAPYGDGGNNPDARAAGIEAYVKCVSDESIPVAQCEGRN